ncbi:hypothetical protein AB0F81_40315 [Actinoplanes sp. NPDC024001]|uniref:DUF7868 domain-containing protein n=1 Tax=Actinoplanes sp. NPDC024001 TaxID=3154598 RepID=UPI0033EE281B
MSNPHPPELAAATAHPLTLRGEPVVARLVMPVSSRNLVFHAIDIRRPERALVSVDNIEAAENPGVAYGVFVGSGDGTEPESYLNVGAISLFGVEMRDDTTVRHDEAPGFRQIFDATTSLQLLAGQGGWDAGAMNVRFELILPLPPTGRESLVQPLIEEQRAAAAQMPVTIGRVGLFVY